MITTKFSACPVNKRAHIKNTWQNIDFIRIYGSPYPDGSDAMGQYEDLTRDPPCDLHADNAEALFSELLEDCLPDSQIATYNNLIKAFICISAKRAGYKNQANKMQKVADYNAKKEQAAANKEIREINKKNADTIKQRSWYERFL
jgi:hypothetical protein